MPTVEYMHCSSQGSYYIPCEVLEKTGNQYRIRFEDLITDSIEEMVVDSEYLRFPSFNEYVIY